MQRHQNHQQTFSLIRATSLLASTREHGTHLITVKGSIHLERRESTSNSRSENFWGLQGPSAEVLARDLISSGADKSLVFVESRLREFWASGPCLLLQ